LSLGHQLLHLLPVFQGYQLNQDLLAVLSLQPVLEDLIKITNQQKIIIIIIITITTTTISIIISTINSSSKVFDCVSY